MDCPKCGLINPESAERCDCGYDFRMGVNKESGASAQAEAPEARGVENLKKEKDWFVCIQGPGDTRRYYLREEVTTVLRNNIIEGMYQKDSPVMVHSKDKNGNWIQTNSTLFEFTKGYFKLRVLYQPVWSHAVQGLTWGAIIGVLLKLIDTFYMLFTVDPSLAFLFVIAIVVCCIPKIGLIGIIVISIIMMKYSHANLFIMLLAAGLIGAALGCLPGMAIGGIIGFSRRNSFLLAKDAPIEPGGLFAKAILLPLAIGVGLIGFYIFVFNPWLLSVME